MIAGLAIFGGLMIFGLLLSLLGRKAPKPEEAPEYDSSGYGGMGESSSSNHSDSHH